MHSVGGGGEREVGSQSFENGNNEPNRTAGSHDFSESKHGSVVV